MKENKSDFEPIELQDFIKETLDSIEKGVNLKKRPMQKEIDFEISVSRTRKVGGGVKVYVFSGEGVSEGSSIAKIRFSVTPDFTNIANGIPQMN